MPTTEPVPPSFFRGLRFGLAAALVLWAGIAFVAVGSLRSAYVSGVRVAGERIDGIVRFDGRFLWISAAAVLLLLREARGRLGHTAAA